MDDGSNPYEVLGVSREASAAEIRMAYHKLSRKYHPDKATNEEAVKRNTTMMFKFNEAYALLSDQTRRRQYDQGMMESDDEESVVSEEHTYQEPPRHQEPPRAAPEYLGRPYQGSMQPTPFFYDCDGRDGRDAEDGRSGSEGNSPGQHGTDGQDAGPATAGEPARDLKIFIKTTVSASSGHFQINIHAVKGTGEVMDPTRPNLTQVPIKMFVSADFTARGGKGGHGGFGGPGGNGARGKRGKDATRYSRGTDGGPGGDGGNGGRGSTGADGGRGGNVRLLINKEDIYLLMRVDACDPHLGVQNRISGGRGGDAGRHGQGGRGGPGGSGGKSYHWSETRHRYDANGRIEPYYVQHSNPGGWNGRRGRNGFSPSDRILRGNDGSDGMFKIHVESSGGTTVFSRRYDLTFQDSITEHLSDLPGRKTFEFGETVLINACRVKNSGYMPTPCQRAMITFEAAEGVNPARADRLFLARNSSLTPGGETEANVGHLHYCCPFPSSLGTDYDPTRKDGTIQYKAHQLGPENDTSNPSLISDFQEKFKNFHRSPERIQMAFPVENRAGILGIHSLGAHETTMLELEISNTSNQSLGTDSKTGRALFVQLYYADDKEYEIPLHKIVVRGDGGHILDIHPPSGNRRGHRKDISFLPRRSDTTVQLTLKLNSSEVRPCSTAGLQADIYLQKIPTLHPGGTTSTDGKKRLVQRRLFVVSHQPKFDEENHADVVLVTSTTSTADQVTAWESLVSDRMGLSSRVYSLSRYGHIDPTKTAEEIELKKSFGDSLVILLNEQYCAQPNVESQRRMTRRPSHLLNSVFDFDESTRFLVGGGQADAVQHLSPREASINAIESNRSSMVIQQKENRKSFQNDLTDFVQTERTQGFAKERVDPSCQVVQVKTRTMLRTPTKTSYQKIVERRSEKMRRWLAKNDKLRSYRVEWRAMETPVRLEACVGEKELRPKCWQVGEFSVFVGPPRFQTSLVLLGEETNTGNDVLSAPRAIHSLTTLHSTVSAAPFEMKMKSYCRSLRALSESSSQDHEEVCTAVRLSLVSDFLWDVSNYYQGRMKVESKENRSPTLQNLLSSEPFWELIGESVSNNDGIALREVASKETSTLLSGFQSAAESKDLSPWWSPFSRKHTARREMCEALEQFEHLLAPLIDKDILDSERAQIEEEAKHHIKDTRGKFWLRRRGRWREALAVVHSPASPRQAASSMSNNMVRARREAEFETKTSHKIKKLSAETASPTDSQIVRNNIHRRLTVLTSIHETTEADRNQFIQPS